MIDFYRICLFFAGLLFTCLCYAEEGTENKFYQPVIGFLEDWKIEWDPAIAESEDALF